MKDAFLTSFCNYPHRMRDGKPIGHECYVLPTEALKLEREGNIEKAQEILRNWKKRKMHRGLKINE